MMKIFKTLLLCMCIVSSQLVLGQEPNDEDNTYSTFVYGVCEMCKERIEEAVISVDGVRSADWNIEQRTLTVEIDSAFDESPLHEAINKVGHDTELSMASNESYTSIHNCCKYRDPEIMANHGTYPEITDIGVAGNCEMCKKRIEEAATSLESVDSATYNIEKQRLFVSTKENFGINKLHQKIASVGHNTDQLIADEKVYNNLPECCKYSSSDTQQQSSQNRDGKVSGTVYKVTKDEKTPLEMAEITTLDGEYFAITDEKGNFEMELPSTSAEIIVSYIGYTPDTIMVSRGTEIEAQLSQIKNLKEVVVSYRKKTSGVNSLKTVKTYQVDESELLKAACCNLAESFETLPAVDVATTDAVTGTRQIKMLGLSGPNISYSQEQLPILTGLSSIQGLSLIPGTWISGMQLNQGIGSVSNGYESVSGQINIQLRNPETMDPAFLNLYGNEGGRFEGNAHLAHRFNDKFSTGVLLHGNQRSRELDRNNDGFMDMNTGHGFVGLNRWKYNSFEDIVAQAGIKYATSHSEAGQLSDIDNPNLWRADTDVDDLTAWAKVGYLLPDNKFSSLALKMNYNKFKQRSEYGNRMYSGDQDRMHAQLLYQNYIGNEDHEIRTGVGINYRKSEEQLSSLNYAIEEVVPHLYGEYTYRYKDIFSAVAGVRYDRHNLYGDFVTPRLHLKYNLDNGLTFRIAAGQARRTASILAEHIGVLASARELIINGNDTDMPYGMPFIKSNNLNFSTDYRWDMFGYEASLSLDYFYTHFDQNVIVDFDQDVSQLNIYSQDEDSRSHNAQMQLDFSPLKRFDIRLAYKWQILKLGYDTGLREAPFTPNHRAFMNLAYETRDKWKFDMTFNLTGSQRIPDTESLAKELQMDDRSPAFLRINTQISKQLFDGFTIYGGAENLTGFQQEYAIINAENPFSDTFDASLIWGPTMGRNLYLGIRYTILENKSEQQAQ